MPNNYRSQEKKDNKTIKKQWDFFIFYLVNIPLK